MYTSIAFNNSIKTSWAIFLEQIAISQHFSSTSKLSNCTLCTSLFLVVLSNINTAIYLPLLDFIIVLRSRKIKIWQLTFSGKFIATWLNFLAHLLWRHWTTKLAFTLLTIFSLQEVFCGYRESERARSKCQFIISDCVTWHKKKEGTEI